MPLVNVMVNSRAYTIACDEGEEDHLRELATHVDKKVRELLTSVGQVGDQRLLLMAGLLITDEYFEALAQLQTQQKDSGALAGAREEIETTQQGAADTLEVVARRLDDLTARLASAA